MCHDPAVSEDYSESDIAIVGMAAHLPGARNVEQYWRNLVEGVESVRFYSDEELIEAGVPRAHLRHPRYVKAAAELPDMELFDGEFFGFSPKEAAIVDPQHRHFLEVCWEALEDAGHPPSKFEGPVGIYGGCGMGSYFYFNLCSNPELVDSVGMFLLRHTGNDKDFLVTRVSHVFDLTGPAVNVQTACSTSLVAVHYAVQSLLNQECDMALAGGVTIELPHRQGYFFEEGEILSPDGHCHAFDHRSQGTIFGSGAGVVVLRRLQDALDDGDHVYAVLRGTAINNDGASKAGYLAPSVQGQATCIVEAHALADVDPRSVGYVECHGTGTYLGDPIEVSALTEAFRQGTDDTGFCKIGSVKTNIGHLDTAAGVASLIKAALVLEREVIPASLNFEKPNPTIDFESTPFVVNHARTDWPRGNEPRRAGVQSLGVGGTNAHVVLQEAPVAQAGSDTAGSKLLLVSARNKGALDGNAKKLAEHLRSDAGQAQPLADVAFTLRHGRHEFDRRRVVVAADHESAARRLAGEEPRRVFSHTALEQPKVVFLFPGGGAQYVGMGQGLYESETTYRQLLDQTFRFLESKGVDDPKGIVFGTAPDAAAKLREMPVQLVSIFASSYAMARVLEERGVEAHAMLGHSLGEYACACLAGVFSFDDALALVWHRASLMESMGEGAMLSVPMTEEALRPHLGADLDLAGVNAPELMLVSGPVAAIEALEAKLAGIDIDAQRVRIDRAAHSRMFDAILDDFRSFIEKLTLKPPTRRFVSSKTGTWITPAEATDPNYWTRHIRETVRFSDAIDTLAAEGPLAWIEAGPGRAVSAFAKANPRAETQAVLSAFRHREEEVPDADFLLELIGRLWALGVFAPADEEDEEASAPLDAVIDADGRRRVRLPTYAFQRQYYFIEPGQARAEAQETERLESVEDFGFEPVFRPVAADVRVDAEEPSGQRWLVFLDDAGVGQRLVATLRKRGDQVTVVRPGDTFAKKSETEFVLAPERGREGYDQLIGDLMQSARVPTRIVHLWLTTGDESFRPGSSFFHRNQERGFYSLLFLAQALADADVPRPMHLTVVTNDALANKGETLRYPEKATALGPVQVLPRELPGVTASLLDLRLPSSSDRLFGGKLMMALVDPFAGKRVVTSQLDQLAELVREEVDAEPKECVAILREGKRFERTYRPRTLADAQAPAVLRKGGVYVITGGLGGLGLVAAERFARDLGAKLVLVGRSALPEREQWDAHVAEHGPLERTSRRILAVRDLEAAGAEVLTVAADVTNVEQMRAVAQQAKARFGAVHGLVHTAGTVADALLQTKSLTEVAEVFAPKVHGTEVLREVFGPLGLDFVVLYSSSSTAIAPTGQVDYVAANAFLDAMPSVAGPEGGAFGRARVQTVNWGIWTHVGMAAEAMQTSDLSREPSELPPTRHPLFAGRRRDRTGTLALFGVHGPATDQGAPWIYDEHRVKHRGTPPADADPRGWALLPGTGYLELAAAAMHELGDAAGGFAIEDLYFLRPLAIDDGAEREVRVKLRRTDAGYNMEVRSECVVEGRRAWQLHAQCGLDLTSLEPAAKVDLDAVAARCRDNIERGDGLRSPQEAHLSFGSRWRVLREVRYGEGEALAELALPPAAEEDLEAGFRLHPGLMDLATGYAMGLIEGYAGGEVWVPVSYESVRVYGALPAEIRSWVRSAGENKSDSPFALFDIDITDADGNVVVAVRRFAIRKMDQAEFGKVRPPSRGDVEMERGAEEGEDRPLSPAEQRLRRNLERGIVPSEGAEALVRLIESGRPQLVVSSLPLDALIAEARETQDLPESGGAKFARPDLDSDYVEPRDDIERTLVGFWEELLGVDQVGVQDSFFDLGGHSLIAVRLFAMVKKTWSVEFPISVLFEAPTVEACAELIKDAIGFTGDAADGAAPVKKKAPKRRYTHLVAMHPGDGGERTPFFLVAGMFGNVLNLRHLAHLLGSDRPFYGLQAKGLYGGDAPHETFEEMARDYIAEMRTVQPKGPYVVGGFSGGGYTALEIARQLREAGEEIAMLVMLDTPALLTPKKLTAKDRATIQLQRFQSKGPGYVLEWAQSRLEWEMGKLRRRFEEPETLGETEFHDEAIEAAFRRALGRYTIPRWEQELHLFRPPLERAYDLGDGRYLDHDREYVYEDNGWGEHCGDVSVYEVPGDHDSMVLEPNVRVMAAKLRELLDAIEG